MWGERVEPGYRSSACSGCGLVAPGGETGCRRLYERVLMHEASDRTLVRVHRLTVDTYCLQHPQRYCRSGKSLAAHLCGLCWVFEYDSDPAIDSAIRRWLDRGQLIERPDIPSFRGTLTVAHVDGSANVAARILAVRQWARSTWRAWESLHPLARQWIERAVLAGAAKPQAVVDARARR